MSEVHDQLGWADYVVWWQTYPLGFTGAEIRPKDDEQKELTHRLTRIENWLDYIINLGANGLLLGPIFESQSHGYDTLNYFRIDPRLGDIHDFESLISACSRRGIRVMLDGVFNHVGRGFEPFQQAMAGIAHTDMFKKKLEVDGSTDFSVFEGHHELPELNHDSDEVVQLVVDVMKFWLDKGISAWRLDAAYAVSPAFWAKVLPQVREAFPHAWFMGEVIHGDYKAIVKDSSLDSLTQYELWKAVWSSIKEGNFFELDWCLQRHNDFLASFTPLTFIGNHDVTRIASQVGEANARIAAVLLFTLGGVPSVYYGDELGYLGNKEEKLGGDDAIRPAFAEHPEPLHGDSESMFRLYQQLVGIRRNNAWLTTAHTSATHVENRNYSYDSIARDDSQRIHVDISLDGSPRASVTKNGRELLSL